MEVGLSQRKQDPFLSLLLDLLLLFSLLSGRLPLGGIVLNLSALLLL